MICRTFILLLDQGSQPFVTRVPPKQYLTPLRTPMPKLTPLANPQNPFCLPFVGLFLYDLKFRYPLRAACVPQVEDRCSKQFKGRYKLFEFTIKL